MVDKNLNQLTVCFCLLWARFKRRTMVRQLYTLQSL